MSRRQREDTQAWCDICQCNIQMANLGSHEQGRRHRENLAKNGMGPPPSSYSPNSSQSRSPSQQHVHNFNGNNMMMMNVDENVGGRGNNNQNQQQGGGGGRRPPRNYPTTMNGSMPPNHQQQQQQSQNPNHQTNYLAPISLLPTSHSQANNAMQNMMNTISQQNQHQQQQGHHHQPSRARSRTNNNMMMMNNQNDDDDEVYGSDEPTYRDSTGTYTLQGSTGGTLNLLCPRCSRLCTPSECSATQSCPGCNTNVSQLKHVYVSHHQNSVSHPSNNTMMMQSQGRGGAAAASAAPNNNNPGMYTWSCPRCTFINAAGSNICIVCSSYKDGSGFQQYPTSSSSVATKDKGVLYVDVDASDNGGRGRSPNPSHASGNHVLPSRLASVARANAEDLFRQAGNSKNPSLAVMSRAASVRNNYGNSANPSSMMMMDPSQQQQQQAFLNNRASIPTNNNNGNNNVFAFPSTNQQQPQVKQEVKTEDVNAIMTEMDEQDSLRCVFCLQSVATHKFTPCDHVILCSACSVEISGKFKPATDQDIQHEEQNKNNRNFRQDPQLLRCFYCRQLSKTIEAAPVNPKWRAPPNSTYPWIGGDAHHFDHFVEEIKAAGRSFIFKQTRPHFNDDEDWERNVRIDECKWVSALDKFKKGWIKAKCPEGSWSGIFGYHGTERKSHQDKSLWNIAKHGFDPARRTRNNHGPGEYFSIHFSQSLEYAKGTNTLVVAFLLRGAQTSMVEDFCYIVNNPLDDLTTNYTLPLFLVHFANHDQPRWSVPRFPYMRWLFKWENDEETDFIAYDLSVNQEINRGFCMWHASKKNQEGDARNVTVTCFNMETEEDNDYEIDFSTYTQTNIETSFTRKITATCIPATPFPKTLWMLCAKNTSSHNTSIDDFWLICDMYAQRSLCDAYYNYQKSKKAAEKARNNRHHHNRHHQISVNSVFAIKMFEKNYQVDMSTFRATYVSSSTGRVTDVSYPIAIVDS